MTVCVLKSPNPPFFYQLAQPRPWASTLLTRCSHMFGHASPLATVRLAGCMLACKRHARFESSGALAEQPAGSGVHSRGAAWMLRQGVACSGAGSSANTLTVWPGRVAQAPRAGRARAPWSCSPCWRLSSRTARLEDQLGLDDETNSEIANGSDMGSSAARVTSVGDLRVRFVVEL